MDEKRRIMKSYFENALPYLRVFYQPIYDLNKKKLNVAEALLRYDDGHHQNIEQVIRKAEEMGCDFLQGYLISKPVSFEDFCAFIDAHNKKESAGWKETLEETGKKNHRKEK